MFKPKFFKLRPILEIIKLLFFCTLRFSFIISLVITDYKIGLKLLQKSGRNKFPYSFITLLDINVNLKFKALKHNLTIWEPTTEDWVCRFQCANERVGRVVLCGFNLKKHA